MKRLLGSVVLGVLCACGGGPSTASSGNPDAGGAPPATIPGPGDGTPPATTPPTVAPAPDAGSPVFQVTARARFNGTFGWGAAPDTELFDGSGSSSSDPEATVSCEWSFGDGSTARGCRTDHLFANAGDYPVTLTATDTNGVSDSATLSVHVTQAGPPGLRWVRMSDNGGPVGSDFVHWVVLASGNTLERLDPATSEIDWQASFGTADRPVHFDGPLFISPGGKQVFARAYEGEEPFTTVGTCIYSLDILSRQGCFTNALAERGGASSEMGAGGEVAAASGSVFNQSVTVRRTDGSTWSVTLFSQTDYGPLPLRINAATAAPGGDAIVAVTSQGGVSYGGQTFDAGSWLMRIHDDGTLLWARPLPFAVGQLGTSALGTVVITANAATAFTWNGDDSPPGDYLATVEANGALRWVRRLPGSALALAVLPLGQAAVVTRTSECAFAVQRWNLDGNQRLSDMFSEATCGDARIDGVAILTDDVIVSGFSKGTVNIGPNAFMNVGFLFDIGGH